ncbi:MAG: hypothetical protein V3R81_02100 [Gammaproteobacteria bacterium]
MKRTRNKFVALLSGLLAGVLLSIPIASIGQDYFQASGILVQRSAISSAEFRTEFANIESLLSDKLPAYTGNGDKIVVVNAGGTALTSITSSAAATLLGLPTHAGAEVITGQWTFEARVDLDNGTALRFYDSTDTDFGAFSHDGTDFNTAFTTTTDWNITGITALQAGTVDADFDAVTATSYDGIAFGDLVDKSASETVTGAWTLPVASITGHVASIDHDSLLNHAANQHLIWSNDLGGTNLHANNSINGALALAAGEVTQLANIGATAISAADWTAVSVLVGTNSGDQTITLTGNVTGTGTGSFAATIAADAVTMDKIADIGTDTFLGRVTASTGTVEVLTNAQAKTALDLTGTNSGDQTITLTGNVTGTGTGSFAATIAADAVTYAKMQNVAADERLLGNVSGAGAIVAELTQAQVITFLGIEAGATADQTSIAGISGTKAQFDTAVSDGNIAYTGGAHHDGFSDALANEHLDWTGDRGGTNLHANNSANGSLALATGEVTQLANIGATTITSGDWTAVAALAGTNTGNESAASESVVGIVERATQTELNTSTDTTRYVSPNILAAAVITTDNLSAAEIGYKGTPINTQNTNYELVLIDAGKTIFKASGGAGETITVPANSSVAFPVGTIIVILNGGGGTLTLAITTDLITQVGSGAVDPFTLADDAMISIIKVTSGAWYLSGTGAT